MRKDFTVNFICIIIAYIAIPALFQLAFPDLIPLRYSSIFQIIIFLIPALILSNYGNGVQFKLRLNLKFKPAVLILLLWGVAGLSLFSLSWELLQSSIIPDSLKHVYDEIMRAQILQQEELVINRSGTVYEYLFIILVIAVIPATCEEFLFRGYLLTNLETKGRLRAILLSSIIFALIHVNAVALIPIFIIGIYLASITIATNSLIPAVIFHFLNNLMVIFSANYSSNYTAVISNPSITMCLLFSAIGLLIMYISYRLLPQ